MGMYDSLLYGQGGVQPSQAPGIPQVPPGVLATPAATPPQEMLLPPPEAPAAPAPAPSFLENMRTNPGISQAMLMMGARLMQGPRHGQDELGALGDAAMIGLTAHQMLKQNQHDQGIAEQEQLRKANLANAQIGEIKQRTDEAKGEQPLKLQQFKLKIDALSRMDDLEKAQQGYKKLKANFFDAYANSTSGNIEQIWLQELQNPALEAAGKLRLQESQIRAHDSQAGENTARAGLITAQTENPEKYASSGKGGSSAAVLNRRDVEANLRVENPNASDAEIKRMVREQETTLKAKDTHSALVDYAGKMGLDPSNPKDLEKIHKGHAALAAMAGKEGGVGSPAPTAAPAAPAPLPPKKDLIVGQNYPGYGVWSGTGFKR